MLRETALNLKSARESGLLSRAPIPGWCLLCTERLRGSREGGAGIRGGVVVHTSRSSWSCNGRLSCDVPIQLLRQVRGNIAGRPSSPAVHPHGISSREQLITTHKTFARTIESTLLYRFDVLQQVPIYLQVLIR